MPNQLLQQLTEIRATSGNFLIPISDDPSGTAILKKITLYNLLSGVSGGGGSATWGGITGTLSSQTDLQSALDAKASIASLGQAAFYNSGQIFYNTPLSGNPTAPTPTAGDNSTSLATTAFVGTAITNSSGGVKSLNGKTGNIILTTSDISGLGEVALYNSGQIFFNTPLSGVPTAPTAIDGTNTTQLATTAFVTSAISNASGGVKSLNGKTGNITLTTSDISGLGQAALYNSGTIFFNSPLSGTPTAPTAAYGTNTTQLATTAFVNTLAISVSGGTPTLPAYSVYANTMSTSSLASGVQTLILGTPAFSVAAGTLIGQTTLSTNNYAQFVLQNTSKGSSASTDLIINNDSGTDSQWFVDLGINSTSGAIAPFPASGAAYLYASDSNELNIGCLGASGTIQFWINSGVLRAGYFDNNLDLNLNGHLNVNGLAGASNSAFIMTGIPYSGGTATTTTPAFLMQPAGAGTVSTWSTNGTYIGINSAQGFNGNFIDCHVSGGASAFSVSAGGFVTSSVFVASSRIQMNGGGSASQSPLLFLQSIYSGGTSTTTYPQLMFQSSTNTTACTGWNALGTYVGINSASNFQGNFIDCHKNNSASLFSVAADGSTLITASGTPNSAALQLTGPVYSGGTATTNTPLLYVNGGTAPTTWNTLGTLFGINAPVLFGGNFIDLHLNGGASVYKVDSAGALTCGTITSNLISAVGVNSTSRISVSYNGGSQASAFQTNGSILRGLTGTTNYPQWFSQPNATTAVTNWNVEGTVFGANVNSTFSGNFVDYRLNGGSVSLFGINYSGLVNAVSLQLIDAGVASKMLKANSSGLIVGAVAGTDYVVPASTTAYSGQHYVIPVNLASGNTVNWDMDVAPNATLNVPSGAFTLANPSNIRAGACGVLTVIQDPVGGRVITWGSAYKFPGGTKFVLSTAANARDEITWYSPDGTNVDCTGVAAFS